MRQDRKGLDDYSSAEFQLNEKKALLMKRLQANQRWADNFDQNIGGLMKHQTNLVDTSRKEYINAKSKHKLGVECLKEQFDYHPEFARGGPDEFRVKSSYAPADEHKIDPGYEEQKARREKKEKLEAAIKRRANKKYENR